MILINLKAHDTGVLFAPLFAKKTAFEVEKTVGDATGGVGVSPALPARSRNKASW